MKAKEFKEITGFTVAGWARTTKRKYYTVVEEVARGYCTLVQQGAGRSHPLWDTWSSMKTRCYNPHSRSYRRYGGRGIRVCPEWFYSFDAFIRDMYEVWEPGLTLDRIDNNGPYSKSNCRWATPIQQSLNSTTNRGCPGVHFCKTAQRWVFRLRKDGKLLFSKRFKNSVEANEYAIQVYEKYNMLEHLCKAQEALYE